MIHRFRRCAQMKEAMAMGENTKIEWADHTFNPWIGCSKVSGGCTNCYAEEMMDRRFGKVQWGDNGTRKKTSAANWKLPLKWNRQAERDGVRRRVFCASLADVFEDRDELKPWRVELFDLIRRTPNLTWMMLTKRPENIKSSISNSVTAINLFDRTDLFPLRCWLKDWENYNPPENVWLGTSVENQETADKRIPELMKVPAAKRFLSMEPLLGRVDLESVGWSEVHRIDVLSGGYWCKEGYNYGVRSAVLGEPKGGFVNHSDIKDILIDWVIVGGESGSNARPMHPDWVRSIRDQCVAAGVPFFFKQWGELQYQLEGNEEVVGGGGFASTQWNSIDGWVGTYGSLHLLDDDVSFFECPDYGECLYRNVGKSKAGRLLDGREWNEVPV